MITSLTNDFVKYLDKLKHKKYRDKEQKFIVEGEHLVEEAQKNNILEKVVIVEGFSYNTDKELIIVSEEVMKKISSLDSPPKIIGLCKMMAKNNIGNKILILDDVQDPGNLGTIVRSSVAFNIDTIILSKNTVDLYNQKVIRSTQGMIFHINIIRDDLVEIIKKLKDENYSIYTTDVDEGINLKDIERSEKFALIMGNEGNGVKEEIANLADKKINIKINSQVESLNVAVATSIILYEFGKYQL